MPKNLVVSSDSHVVEPEDLWTSRMDAKYQDRAPRVVRMEEGDWWYCDGKKVVGLGIGAQAGVRFEDQLKLRPEHRYEEVRLGGYIPEEHIKDMDLDGVDVSILYSSINFMMYNVVEDGDLLTAVNSAYNDWVAEFIRPYPDRLKGICMINLDDIQVGIREMERCAKLGFAGALIPVVPAESKVYSSPDYEPLWAAAQDLGIPLSFHVLTNRPGPGQEFANPDSTTASFSCNRDHWVKMSLGHIIYSGVFERYPKLRVGSVEFELGWAAHFVEQLDYTYTQRSQRPDWHRFKENMLPSDYFHRNVFLGFQDDATGVRLRDIIGVDNLMWGSDYPHTESTFPRSRQILGEILADCTEEEKAKISGGNAARVYGIS